METEVTETSFINSLVGGQKVPNIQLDTFEGPMSLLLYLIKKNEIDIYNIPIHEITKQYLEFIQIMKELNLEVAGEFIAMAATLIYIKSRMLVPQYGENGEEIIEDPRKELVQKLLEYQKYQEAGKQIYKRPLLNRDVWNRGVKEHITRDGSQDEIILDEKGLFALIAAFRALQKQAIEKPHNVKAKGLSIAGRIVEIKNKFIMGKQLEFKDLLSENFTQTELLITFLSILELSRLGYTRITQLDPLSNIYIETVKPVSAQEIVNRVQEFDSTGAAQAADQIMLEAESDLQNETLEEHAMAQLESSELSEDAEVIAVESGELT